MSRVWAVARQMIAESLRAKVVIVFLVLIGAVVVGLPFSISGDSSLTGAVQSFLSYALIVTSVLLAMLTIFLSRSLSDEFVNRQLFLVMTKPIPRWQFLFGKWLGLTLLNALFLTCSGLTMYVMVQYIKRTRPPIDAEEALAAGAELTDSYDWKKLHNEVLVARHGIAFTPPDFSRQVEQELTKNKEQGVYADHPHFDEEEERARLHAKYDARWRVVGPLESRVFHFKNVLCDRSPDSEIQLRYKAEVSRYTPDEIFRCLWRFGDPAKQTPLYSVPRRDVVGRWHTMRVPADAVAPDHTLRVEFFNENPFAGEAQARNIIEFRKSDEVEVLFVVGSFEWNLVRLLVIIMCKLMFLAAVALLMTTVFSFPVACLAAFTVYIVAAAQPFFAEAFDYIVNDYSWMERWHLGEWTRQIVWLIFGDLSRFDAVEDFVNGRNVSLVWVLLAVFELALIRGTAILGLAMLLFHRREVAEISL